MGARIILAAVLLLPVTAFAAEPPNITDLCQELVEYQPAADVEYQPGVDVNGESVVPADLNGGTQIQLPEATRVFITVEQAQQLNIPSNTPYKPTAILGEVSVQKNGDVYFNGKRVSQPQLQVLCQTPEKVEP